MSDSDDSTNSSDSAKSDEGTRTYIVSVPANKKIKVPASASALEIPIDCGIDEIVGMIHATEKVVNTFNISCCSSCYKIFGKCIKIKVADNNI